MIVEADGVTIFATLFNVAWTSEGFGAKKPQRDFHIHFILLLVEVLKRELIVLKRWGKGKGNTYRAGA